MTQPISKEEPLSTIFRQGNLLSCDVTTSYMGNTFLWMVQKMIREKVIYVKDSFMSGNE